MSVPGLASPWSPLRSHPRPVARRAGGGARGAPEEDGVAQPWPFLAKGLSSEATFEFSAWLRKRASEATAAPGDDAHALAWKDASQKFHELLGESPEWMDRFHPTAEAVEPPVPKDTIPPGPYQLASCSLMGVEVWREGEPMDWNVITARMAVAVARNRREEK
jgi:hypothetical protein